MANRTITTTTVKRGPVWNTSRGINFAYAEFDFGDAIKFGASISNTLVIQMVPIPHGAKIVDMFATFYNRTDGVFTVGDNSLTNRYITSLSLSSDAQTNLLNNPAGAGYKISLTASDESLWEPISIFTTTAILSASTTGCVHMGVYYLMEPAT